MERNLVKIIKEIAIENNVSYEGFSDDWVIKLTKNNKTYFICGFIFEDNNAAINGILKDKSALYQILTSHNIPAVEHIYFYRKLNDLINNYDENNPLVDLFNKHGKLVLKNNTGTGGSDVFLVENIQELQEAASTLKSRFRKFTVCPYYNINHEWRVIMHNSKAQVVYEKIRPFVIGDGINSIQVLTDQKYPNGVTISKKLDLNFIPKTNEKVLLNWKHNLGQGASANIVEDPALATKLSKMAQKVCKLLNIKFASIDIIESNGEFKILEINGGIMMEKFASFSKETYQKAKQIYLLALKDFLKS